MGRRWSVISSQVPASLRTRGRLTGSAAAAIAAVLSGVLFIGCRQPPPNAGAEKAPVSVEESVIPQEPAGSRPPIEDVIALHTNELLAIEGVVVVFAGENAERQPVITIGVSEKTEKIVRSIPQTLEGYPVVIQETGPIAPR